MNGEVERQNKDILKRLKISQALKKNWQQELLDYLTMYNSTPHTTTGKTPSELFFKRQFRDKLPSSIDLENIQPDDEIIDKDKIEKQKGKEFADRKRRATDNTNLEIGDKVYQKNLIRASKVTPDFDSTPHTVVDKKGGDIIVKDDHSGQKYRRNIIHLKKVEGQWKVTEN